MRSSSGSNFFNSLVLNLLLLSYLISLIPAKWRGVPWLDNKQVEQRIDDKDDKWKSFRDLALQKRGLSPVQPLRRVKSAWILRHNLDREKPAEYEMKGYKELTRLGFAIESCKRLVYFFSYAFGVTMNLYAFSLVFSTQKQSQEQREEQDESHGAPTDEEGFSMWTCLISNGCNFIISAYLAALLLLQCLQFPHQSPPFLSKIYVPFTLR